MSSSKVLAGLIVGSVALANSAPADAFCGFYVSGGGKAMFNDATQVVLVREGTRTVLSMQNDYKGPVEDFAMVVPVPVVLKKEHVKTLTKDIFDRIDALGAPRLVEYWEQDPCPKFRRDMYPPPEAAPTMALGDAEDRSMRQAEKPKVVIEAKFTVGEYNILILSATEASALETWLVDNKYKIPAGAEPLLRPYIENGSKFFVAKVDPKKVAFENGRAALSPLRFHYESEEFSLPVRLGLANSSGTQDLIINVISKDTRYEVANMKNVTIPTNFDVKDSVRTRFGEFYAALFDKTIAANPKAIVTEYAWTAFPQSMKCDPCPPGDMLATDADMMTLGGDIVGGNIAQGGFVLTRLHARYGKNDLKDDLVFKAATPIIGGREFRNASGKLEYGSTEARPEQGGMNFFQARYAIRHWWTGPIACKNPRRGIWGGPPNGGSQMVVARKLAFAPRGKLRLPLIVKRDVPEIGVKKWRPPIKPIAPPTTKSPSSGKTQFLFAGVLAALGALASALVHRRRR
jgi:hypothetical protein